MNAGQQFAAASLVSAVIDFLLLAGVAWHYRKTIHRSYALRAAYPATLGIYLVFAYAYWQVLFGDSSPTSVLRLAAVIVFNLLFAVVALATASKAKSEAQAAQVAAATRKAVESEEKRLALEKSWLDERQTYLVVIGHELATPINLITGYLDMLAAILPAISRELIQDHEQVEQLRMFAEGAISGAARLRIMLRMFNATNDKPRMIPVNLCDVVYKAINHADLYTATRRSAEDVPITVECSPLVIHGDLVMLETAIFELVRNALKATKNGYVQVVVSQAGDTAVLSVEDNGRGLRPADISRIWEAGYQSSAPYQTRPDEGTGYGLAVVLHIAKLHGGDAALEWTEPEQGSRFAIYLPMG